MNWKSAVEKINSETYVLPDGWDSRDSIAEELECSPEKVDDHLRPGLKSGRFIKQQYRVWDRNLKRNVMVTAYHDTALDKAPAPTAAFDAAKAEELKRQGKTYAEIGAEMGLTRDSVRAKMRRVG